MLFNSCSTQTNEANAETETQPVTIKTKISINTYTSSFIFPH